MSALREYIISVITVAFLGGLLCDLLKEGTGKEVVRLLYGLSLTLTVICPFTDIRMGDVTKQAAPLLVEGRIASSDGEKMAERAMSDIIKRETEAYIQNKAADYHTDLAVEIVLENAVPVSVIMKGSVSPYAKAQLEMMLEEELNISKENQQWT